MAALEAALERAIPGNAQVVGVVAEPGTGRAAFATSSWSGVERGRSRSTRGTGWPMGRRCRGSRFSRSFVATSGSPIRTTRGRARQDRRTDGAPRRESRRMAGGGFDFLGVPDSSKVYGRRSLRRGSTWKHSLPRSEVSGWISSAPVDRGDREGVVRRSVDQQGGRLLRGSPEGRDRRRRMPTSRSCPRNSVSMTSASSRGELRD
jgi:hypothetical protein